MSYFKYNDIQKHAEQILPSAFEIFTFQTLASFTFLSLTFAHDYQFL